MKLWALQAQRLERNAAGLPAEQSRAITSALNISLFRSSGTALLHPVSSSFDMTLHGPGFVLCRMFLLSLCTPGGFVTRPGHDSLREQEGGCRLREPHRGCGRANIIWASFQAKCKLKRLTLLSHGSAPERPGWLVPITCLWNKATKAILRSNLQLPPDDEAGRGGLRYAVPHELVNKDGLLTTVYELPLKQLSAQGHSLFNWRLQLMTKPLQSLPPNQTKACAAVCFFLAFIAILTCDKTTAFSQPG